MRDKYWAMFTAIKHKEQYYRQYQLVVKRRNAVVSGICTFASAGSIAGWCLWSEVPLLWALIMGVAQVVQVFKPMLPFSALLTGLHYMLPELAVLLNEIDHEWDKVSGMDPASDSYTEIISTMIYRREDQYEELTSRFLNDVYCPTISKCDSAAEAATRAYFKQRYNV